MERQLFYVFLNSPLDIAYGMAAGKNAEEVRDAFVQDGRNHPLGWLYLSFEGLPPVFSFMVFDPARERLLGYRMGWLAGLQAIIHGRGETP